MRVRVGVCASASVSVYVWECVSARVYVLECVFARVGVCVRVCLCGCVCSVQAHGRCIDATCSGSAISWQVWAVLFCRATD